MESFDESNFINVVELKRKADCHVAQINQLKNDLHKNNEEHKVGHSSIKHAMKDILE